MIHIHRTNLAPGTRLALNTHAGGGMPSGSIRKGHAVTEIMDGNGLRWQARCVQWARLPLWEVMGSFKLPYPSSLMDKIWAAKAQFSQDMHGLLNMHTRVLRNNTHLPQ